MALQYIDTRLTGASPYSGSLHAGTCRPGARVEFGRTDRKPRVNLVQRAAKLAFLTGIAASILLAWQGITLHVQQFSVRPDSASPVATTVSRWVHSWTASLKPFPAAPLADGVFEAESRMTASQLLNRWNPLIAQASQRFGIPARWIRAVVQTESAGRTMSTAFHPITSRAGAMGVMQLMPGTYKQMREQYHLGANPYFPRDNILAGAAYLSWLFHKYGYPTMFAAYNDGPGHLEERLFRGGLLPAETRNYVRHIVTEVAGGATPAGSSANGAITFTRPNGNPVKIDVAKITSVRLPLAGEYPADVHAVITAGDVRQAVRESYDTVKNVVLTQRGLGVPVGRSSQRNLRVADRQHSRLALARHKSRHHAVGSRIAETGHRVNVLFGDAAANGTIRVHPLRVSGRS